MSSWNLLGKSYEKIPLLASANLWGDYPPKPTGGLPQDAGGEQVGVYLLFGEDEEGGAPKVYIGQTSSLKTRLPQHNAGKEFWSRALIAVSLTNSLTNTRASYLEWLSIQKAQQASRCVLDNGNAGGRPHTPAPLLADRSEIHDTIRVLIATLGHPVFEPLTPATSIGSPAAGVFHCRASDADARGYTRRKGSLC